jgi:hypothetical protein
MLPPGQVAMNERKSQKVHTDSFPQFHQEVILSAMGEMSGGVEKR